VREIRTPRSVNFDPFKLSSAVRPLYWARRQRRASTGFGVLIGSGLWLIGIPSALLWGILATVLRFAPYIGSVIAAAFPLALAVAVDPGWSMLVWTALLFFVAEPVVGQVFEPIYASALSARSSRVACRAIRLQRNLAWAPAQRFSGCFRKTGSVEPPRSAVTGQKRLQKCACR
jgi:hypothetical protein